MFFPSVHCQEKPDNKLKSCISPESKLCILEFNHTGDKYVNIEMVIYSSPEFFLIN